MTGIEEMSHAILDWTSVMSWRLEEEEKNEENFFAGSHIVKMSNNLRDSQASFWNIFFSDITPF